MIPRRGEKVRGGGFEEIDEVSEDPVSTQKLAVSDKLKRGAWSRRGNRRVVRFLLTIMSVTAGGRRSITREVGVGLIFQDIGLGEEK